LAREIEAEIGAGAYRLTPEELADINGPSDVEIGHFATAEEVEAVFAKHAR
jgi:hypothetical protein